MHNCKFNTRDILEITKDLGYAISKVQSKERQSLMIAAVVKLTEVSKGNFDFGDKSLEEILEDKLSLFTRNSSSVHFSQESTKENQPIMRRGAPIDHTKNRLRSGNEHARNVMKDSSRRSPLCSLCSLPDHKVGSHRCGVLMQHKAKFIRAKESTGFADSLGNPALCHVEEASGSTKISSGDGCQRITAFQVLPPHGCEAMLLSGV